MRIKLSEKDIPTIAAMGSWPANAPADMNVARGDIAKRLIPWRDYPRFILAGSKKTLNLLDRQLGNTERTYKTFLLKNGLVEDIVKLSIQENSVIVFGFIIDFSDFPSISLESTALRITDVEGV